MIWLLSDSCFIFAAVCKLAQVFDWPQRLCARTGGVSGQVTQLTHVNLRALCRRTLEVGAGNGQLLQCGKGS